MPNPLYVKCHQQYKKPSMDEFKNALKAQDDGFFQKMIEIARQRGISEKAIQEGMTYIDTLRH